MDPKSRTSLTLYLALRTLQLNACVLTGFTFCYTISQYKYHYCNYNTGCTPQQQAAAAVPRIYIYLLTTIVATVLTSIYLTYTRLATLLSPTVTAAPPPAIPWNSSNRPIPLTILLRHIPLPLLLDGTLLLTYTYHFHSYSYTHILGHNHVIPYCYLSEYWNPRIPGMTRTGATNNHGRRDVLSEFFKNLRVEVKDCFLGQVGWVGSLVMLGFMVFVLGLEGYYVWCERKVVRVVGEEQGRDEKRDLKILVGE